MDAPGPVVARRLEGNAVRDIESGQSHEKLLVPHAVLERDDDRSALEHRMDRMERGLGRLRLDEEDRRVEAPPAHLRRVRERGELRRRFGASRQD